MKTLIQQVWGGTWDSVFPMNIQVRQILWDPGPYFEYQGSIWYFHYALGYSSVEKYFLHSSLYLFTHSLCIRTCSQHPLTPRHEPSNRQYKNGHVSMANIEKISSTEMKSLHHTHTHTMNMIRSKIGEHYSVAWYPKEVVALPVSEGKTPQSMAGGSPGKTGQVWCVHGLERTRILRNISNSLNF